MFNLGRLLSSFRIIASGRSVKLRYFEHSDLKFISEWLKNPDLIRFAFGMSAEENDLKKVAESFLYETEYFGGNIITILSLSGSPIGIIKISPNYGDGYMTLGIMIGDASNQGKGKGREAMILAMNHLFKHKCINHIEVDTAIFNEKAQRCFKKCGFRKVKNFTEKDYVTKILMYKILLSITKEEFRDVYKNYISEIA